MEKTTKCTQGNRSTEEILEEIVCILAKGDITKKDSIEWGVTLNECKIYLEYQSREILFREAVIAFFVGETEEDKKKRYKEEYKKACKVIGKKIEEDIDIEVIDWQKIKSN